MIRLSLSGFYKSIPRGAWNEEDEEVCSRSSAPGRACRWCGVSRSCAPCCWRRIAGLSTSLLHRLLVDKGINEMVVKGSGCWRGYGRFHKLNPGCNPYSTQQKPKQHPHVSTTRRFGKFIVDRNESATKKSRVVHSTRLFVLTESNATPSKNYAKRCARCRRCGSNPPLPAYQCGRWSGR